MKIFLIVFFAIYSHFVFASGGGFFGGSGGGITPNSCDPSEFAVGIAADGTLSCETPTGSGTVTSVDLSVSPSSLFAISGNPVTTSGTLAWSMKTQGSNCAVAAPSDGSTGAMSCRSLVGADLPNPSSSSLGGVQSKVSVSHNFLTAISTSGVPAAAQPAFTDISGTAQISQGGTGVTSVTTVPAASTFAGWDTNSNFSANNVLDGYATTATSAGTTTLTVASAEQQYFTGSTTHTVKLPVTSTLVAGQSFVVVNLSSGVVTLQSSGSNTLQAMAANTQVRATVISTSGTGTASWNWVYGTVQGSLPTAGITALTADVTASGSGSVAATVASVGGSSASSVHTAELAANAATSTVTASTIPKWDANSNLSSNNSLVGYTTTATAATTTTLTVGSTQLQYFTGSTTQTVKLPVVSTLVLGQQFTIHNNSTGVVTVQSSGANSIQAMAANTQLTATVISTSGTGTASWDSVYSSLFNTNLMTISSTLEPLELQFKALTAGSTGNSYGGLGLYTTAGQMALVAINANNYPGGGLYVANQLAVSAQPGSAGMLFVSRDNNQIDFAVGGFTSTQRMLHITSNTVDLYAGAGTSILGVSTSFVTTTVPVKSTGFYSKEAGGGADCSGGGTLSGGTLTVTTSCAKTTSRILVTDTTTGALTNIGIPVVSTKSNGSFVVTSSNVLDTSTFDWFIVNVY